MKGSNGQVNAEVLLNICKQVAKQITANSEFVNYVKEKQREIQDEYGKRVHKQELFEFYEAQKLLNDYITKFVKTLIQDLSNDPNNGFVIEPLVAQQVLQKILESFATKFALEQKFFKQYIENELPYFYNAFAIIVHEINTTYGEMIVQIENEAISELDFASPLHKQFFTKLYDFVVEVIKCEGSVIDKPLSIISPDESNVDLISSKLIAAKYIPTPKEYYLLKDVVALRDELHKAFINETQFGTMSGTLTQEDLHNLRYDIENQDPNGICSFFETELNKENQRNIIAL